VHRHRATRIPGFDRSYGLISPRQSTSTAFVFVHGFWGDCYSTWQDTQILVDEYDSAFPLFGEADLFFFDYDAAGNFVGPSTDRLTQFTKLLFPEPPDDLFSEDISDTDWGKDLPFGRLFIRRKPYRYNSLILVGHSLGAVIIRKMIADLASEYVKACSREPAQKSRLLSEAPVLKADLRLMSPAHLGFRPARALGAAFSLTPIAGLLRALLAFYRAFTELDSDSHIIQSLRRRTEELARTNPEIPALSAKILWAQFDDIVTIERYDCDSASSYAPDQTHTTVCKPLRGYLRPLEFLTEYGEAYGHTRRA
jgi:pimeloyl-ACP methyl ester carboxylesterase